MQNHSNSKTELDPVSKAIRMLGDIVEMIDKGETTPADLQDIRADAAQAYNELIGRETTDTEKRAISSLQYAAKEIEGRDYPGENLDVIGYLDEAHEVLTGVKLFVCPGPTHHTALS